MEGTSSGKPSNYTAILTIWEKDKKIKISLSSIINELNKYSLIKFKINFQE